MKTIGNFSRRTFLRQSFGAGAFVLAEPSQLGMPDKEMCFVFNKGIPKVSTTF
jgi:hypothetical protein